MSVQVAQVVLAVAGAYLALGVLFAPAFAWRGAGRLDAAAREGSLGFRLLILPGSAALWPLLAWLWWRGGRREAAP